MMRHSIVRFLCILCPLLIIYGKSEGNKCGNNSVELCATLDLAKECDKLSFCAPLWSTLSLEKIEDSASGICNISTLLIQNIQNTLDKAVRGQEMKGIKTELKATCAMLSQLVAEKYGSLCEKITEKYFTDVVVLLRLKMNPKSISVLLGNCQREKVLSVEEKTDQKGGINEQHQKTFISLSHFNKPHSSQEPSSNECSLCTHVLDGLQPLLINNASSLEIKDALDKVCSNLPVQYPNDQCNKFMDQYTLLFIHLLANEVPPKKLCHFIDICTFDQNQSVNSEKIQRLHYLPQTPSPPSVNQNQKICEMGPKYYCRSKAEAVECGESAMELCQKLFWRFWFNG